MQTMNENHDENVYPCVFGKVGRIKFVNCRQYQSLVMEGVDGIHCEI